MTKRTTDIDIQIGLKVKARRKLLGFSPQQFASLLSVSHQQLYKYENGQDRLSAAQLGKIAKILNSPMSYFYSDNTLPFEKPALNDSFMASQIVNEPETKSLVKHYIAIGDSRTRMAVVELVASINKYLTKRAS